MEREDRPEELHTEADDEEPLGPREAGAAGEQTERPLRGVPLNVQTVYGDVDEGFDNEDQADAHHAEPGEHL
jgi:hypothetical protein